MFENLFCVLIWFQSLLCYPGRQAISVARNRWIHWGNQLEKNMLLANEGSATWILKQKRGKMVSVILKIEAVNYWIGGIIAKRFLFFLFCFVKIEIGEKESVVDVRWVWWLVVVACKGIDHYEKLKEMIQYLWCTNL